MFEMMTSKMTTDLNVFSSLMKNQVVSNLNKLWLSQYIRVGWERKTSISASNQCNQTISLVVDVITWFSASVKDWEIMDCFLLFQEIRESPKKIQKPIIDLQYVGSPLWSASEYAQSSNKEVDGSKRLWKTVPWRYCKTWRTIAQWMEVGETTNWLTTWTIYAMFVWTSNSEIYKAPNNNTVYNKIWQE